MLTKTKIGIIVAVLISVLLGGLGILILVSPGTSSFLMANLSFRPLATTEPTLTEMEGDEIEETLTPVHNETRSPEPEETLTPVHNETSSPQPEPTDSPEPIATQSPQPQPIDSPEPVATESPSPPPSEISAAQRCANTRTECMSAANQANRSCRDQAQRDYDQCIQTHGEEAWQSCSSERNNAWSQCRVNFETTAEACHDSWLECRGLEVPTPPDPRPAPDPLPTEPPIAHPDPDDLQQCAQNRTQCASRVSEEARHCRDQARHAYNECLRNRGGGQAAQIECSVEFNSALSGCRSRRESGLQECHAIWLDCRLYLLPEEQIAEQCVDRLSQCVDRVNSTHGTCRQSVEAAAAVCRQLLGQNNEYCRFIRDTGHNMCNIRKDRENQMCHDEWWQCAMVR